MNIATKRMLSVIGVGLGVIILGMVWSIVNTALASIQKDLSASVFQLQWMMNCFGIFICVPLLTMGKLGDAYGRKRLFLYGLTLAFIASFIAGFAKNVDVLIACMGLFGLSGSIILPLSQALLVHQFPESEKDKAVGLWSLFASLSLATGPLVGGVILNFLGWRWIYWINVPLIVLIIPLIVLSVKKDEKQLHKLECDWKGVGLLALIICSFIIAIMQGPTWGWSSFSTIGLLGVSLISLLVFVALEKKSQKPLFRPDLFLQKSFLFSAIPNACMIGYIWIVFFLIPLYLQNMKGFEPIEVGALLLLVTLPVAFLSIPVSKLYRSLGVKPLLLIGFLLLALAAMSQIIFISKGEFWSIGLSCLIIGIGWALVWGPSITFAVSSLPHHLAGIASGMFTTLQELGAITTLAIAGVIFRMLHQSALAPQMQKITKALEGLSSEEIESLITNPVAVERHLGEASPFLPILKRAFIVGYEGAFSFLLISSLVAVFLIIFIPKNKHMQLKK